VDERRHRGWGLMRVSGLRWLKVRGLSGGGTAPAVDRPAPNPMNGGRGEGRGIRYETGGRTQLVGRGLVAGLATTLVTGLFAGVFAGVASAAPLPACTASSVSTCAASLSMTSAALGVHGNASNPLTPLGAVKGTVNASTGVVSNATISTFSYHEPPTPINTFSTETIVVSQKNAGTGSGAIKFTGAVTIDEGLSIFITVKEPAIQQCRTSATVVLQSTSPYDVATKDVPLEATTFTIENFSSNTTPTPTPHKNCALAFGALNTRFAGSSGNIYTIDLHGTLPLPPPRLLPLSLP
jgi:hypothetical protein